MWGGALYLLAGIIDLLPWLINFFRKVRGVYQCVWKGFGAHPEYSRITQTLNAKPSSLAIASSPTLQTLNPVGFGVYACTVACIVVSSRQLIDN